MKHRSRLHQAVARKPLRQGDVILLPVAAMPAGCVLRQREQGRVVLARGEATGHHHAIADEHVSLHDTAQEAGVSYLEVRAAMAALTHEEHSPIAVPSGCYRVVIKREYSPEAIRRVAD